MINVKRLTKKGKVHLDSLYTKKNRGKIPDIDYWNSGWEWMILICYFNYIITYIKQYDWTYLRVREKEINLKFREIRVNTLR